MAEQEEPVRRRVALKVIKLGMDTRSVIARFEAERQALAMMDHPNIAKILDGGVTESGRPYFVMDLVQGLPIIQFCDEANLSTRARLDLFLEVCSAIQHAHQKGIIHRDIKPSNILVTLHGDKPVPKVIDFGIAKATQQRLTDKTLFTQFQQFIGTPAYMSPEQATLSGFDIDTRSDIYSLGVLLYELLTGKTPFDAKELLQAGLDEMRRTLREKEPERPSTRVSTLGGEELTTTAKRRGLDAPKLVNVLSGDLDWIAMKCLEKDRARRYETANALASDIQRHLNNEPVVACPPSTAYRFRKMVRRNKLAFAAGGGIAVALVIGLAIALWQSIEKSRAYNRAIIAEKNAQSEAQFLKDMLHDLAPSVTLGRDPTMVRELLDRAANRVDSSLLNQPEITIELRTTLAATYGELGFFEKMEALAEKNLAFATSVFGEENLAVANALSQFGEAKMYRGDQEQAETFTRKALQIRRNILGQDHLDIARSLRRLGNILHDRRKSLDSRAAYREGLAICLKQREQSAVEADLLEGLAIDLRYGELDEAETVSRRSLEIRRKLGGEDPSFIGTLLVLGNVLDDNGKLAEARIPYTEALTMSQKLFGKEHYLVAKAMRGIAHSLRAEGNLSEAESLLHDAVATQRKLNLKDNIELSWSLDDLASLCEKVGKLDEAEAYYREALAINKRISRHFILFHLASLLRKQGRVQDARNTFHEALDVLQIEADTGNAYRQNYLAWLLATSADSELRDGRRAVSYATKAVTTTHRTNATYLDTLAAAYAESADFANAMRAQKEAMALLRTQAEKNSYASRLQLYQSASAYHERE